jgi:hypothetical protein
MLDECVDPLRNIRRCECLLAEVAGECGRQRLTVNLIGRVHGSFFFILWYGSDYRIQLFVKPRCDSDDPNAALRNKKKI